jgi:phenylacetate-CoA ligase
MAGIAGAQERLRGLLRGLEATQWYTPVALAALQSRELADLTAHLDIHSAHFRARLRSAGLNRIELLAPGGLQRLPVLTRRVLQNSADLYCNNVPDHHGTTYENRTSGSTGEPVTVLRTARTGMDWMAATMRDHLWHKRDFRLRFCAIRTQFTELAIVPDWGPPVNWLFKSGPLLAIPTTLDIARQTELILEFEPQLLMIYPSDLAGIVSAGTRLPSVRQILTVGETLSPATRAQASTLLDAPVVDLYSSQELGTIALQCPDSGLYHVMAENLLLEVLNGDGTACREGEMGRVVATDLRNFATPLVRYDIGDWAEVGPPCPCGRGLPTLSRIFGRERNLLLMPDGTRRWPFLGSVKFGDLGAVESGEPPPVMQFQFIQESRDTIELRLVTRRALSPGEERDLAARVQTALGFAFRVRFAYFAERIPTGPNGEFEEFVCKAAGPTPSVD